MLNARPHLGFALEIIQADVLARWHRAKKTMYSLIPVLMNTV